MKIRPVSLCSFLVTACFLASPLPGEAGLSPDLWDNYLALAQNMPLANFSGCPGRLLRPVQTGAAAFTHAWKFRKQTYELHFDSAQSLGRTVYDLALHSGDISSDISRERVEAGVEGFHYGMDQICAWLNDVFAGKRETPVHETLVFIGYLLQDQAVVLRDGKFEPRPEIKHVLAAAEGRKRSMEENLNHERLHVFWDEDPAFQEQALKAWDALSPSVQKAARDKLNHYADNDALRLEEWAVRQTQAGHIILKDF